jgi:GDP-D-mannose dehydratase
VPDPEADKGIDPTDATRRGQSLTAVDRELKVAHVDADNPSRGDSTKARSVLGWEPTISFNEMVAEMVEADLRRHSAKSMF